MRFPKQEKQGDQAQHAYNRLVEWGQSSHRVNIESLLGNFYLNLVKV